MERASKHLGVRTRCINHVHVLVFQYFRQTLYLMNEHVFIKMFVSNTYVYFPLQKNNKSYNNSYAPAGSYECFIPR